MTLEAVKAHLHEYIEQAGEHKIMAMYTLLNETRGAEDTLYDEATLTMLEKRLENMVNGTDETYTLDQTVERLKQYRKQYGI